MLEDQQWLDISMAQKTAFVLDRYQTITNILSRHGIPYFDMYAADVKSHLWHELILHQECRFISPV
jgi:hypothetical protein